MPTRPQEEVVEEEFTTLAWLPVFNLVAGKIGQVHARHEVGTVPPTPPP